MDNRKTFRYPIEQSIAAAWMNNGRARRVVGQTRDISPSGVFLYLDHAPTVGSPIELSLEFPSKVTTKQSSPVVCRGRVVRVEPQIVADKFGIAAEIESCADLAPGDS